MVLDLDADYQALLKEAPLSALPRHEALRLIHGALRLSMHVLARDPAWIEAFQANIRRIKERKASHDRLDLQWP